MDIKIKKIKIINFKCFKDFSIELNDGMNILVGNNEAGKSTVLQAILLALCCSFEGRPLKYSLSQYLFNHECVNNYLSNIKNKPQLPTITIEISFADDAYPPYCGNWNQSREQACGITLKIEFDEEYAEAYNELLKEPDQIKSLPIEFYKITWKSFARDNIVAQHQPLKVAFVDTASTKYSNGSDYYIARIIRDELESIENFQLTQAYRYAREKFGQVTAISSINKRLREKAKLSSKNIKIDIDLDSATAWEYALKAHLDDIPFSQIGQGEQCIVKANLALGHKKTKDANIILFEEPENHLSHSKLNELISYIEQADPGKQIIVSTHSSFVCNKLGFDKIILINQSQAMRFADLSPETFNFFKKLSGYDTLRLLLCRKAILVEGDSDELIFQRAYMQSHGGKLPIQNGIDVISVGLTHLRFLEIAKCVGCKAAVITDNDGNYKHNIEEKYKDYLANPNIKIFADADDSLRTLEPQFANLYKDDIVLLQKMLQISHVKDHNDFATIVQYMQNDKPGWALRVFEYQYSIKFPEYILQAVRWCDE